MIRTQRSPRTQDRSGMSSTDRPDLVFMGATVETMTDGAGPADAVAVRDGRIVFVGSSADVRPRSSPEPG